MNTFRQLALIGPTASGKTALGIQVAQYMNAYILSLDSLSIYKEIDIASAKPSIEERGDIVHFGIDYIAPDQHFDVKTFIKLYHEVSAKCLIDKKNLVIVGGTSFYLKMLLDGISELPSISDKTKNKTSEYLKDLDSAYHQLSTIDAEYMHKIESNDTYRIEKALNIYFETALTPTDYFRKFPPMPTITHALPIYQIVWDKSLLRERIALRTSIMIENGLINEVCMLEKTYSRKPNCMKSIGIKETLAYLDGIYNKNMLIEKITVNTARLAKRQTTFNNSQFENVIKGSVGELRNLLLN